jgi:hypothetical protein
MANQNRFEGYPVLCWTIDDWQQFYSAIKEQEPSFDLKDYLNDYNRASFENIVQLFDSAPFKLNLGGKTEKSKLIATDKPMGIFDFSLASRGLYKVPEYFSQKLANEHPDKFKDFELPSGVVPPNLVQQTVENGEKVYFYQDGNEVFDCEIRQKGQTAIDDGVQGAKLKFATKNRKVYLTHKRNKGKVKYVEIYSLFYYSSLSGDTQFAIRHIPAIMVAEYLESIGVMTRIYMTRFVELNKKTWQLKKTNSNGVDLPMYAMSTKKKFKNNLFIQPIIAKEFGQDFDKSLAFMVSSNNYNDVYRKLSVWAVKKEVVEQNIDEYNDVFGNPDWTRGDYYEGFERYKNKYQEYVKLGLFKSKEVLPEAMMFFHDMVIKSRLYQFIEELKEFKRSLGFSGYHDESKYLINQNINPFFNWWMRLSATVLKNKIDIVNSRELRKDLAAIKNEVYSFVTELNEIVKNADKNIVGGGQTLPEFFRKYGNLILGSVDYDGWSDPSYEIYWKYGYDILDENGQFTFEKYITNITAEITTYAEGIFFETEEDEKEVRENLLENVLEELINI